MCNILYKNCILNYRVKAFFLTLCLFRDLLIQTIENCGFQYQEFLLSPTSVSTTIINLNKFSQRELDSIKKWIHFE